jgi:hypothetical protein
MFLDRLERAEDEFLHMLVGRSGWLNLTTDFRAPE